MTPIGASMLGFWTMFRSTTKPSRPNKFSTVFTQGPIYPDPFITAQPQDQTVTPESAVSFAVTASGTGPFTYQWQKNDNDLSGQTGATLSFSSVKLTDAGQYRVLVTGLGGTAISREAVLAVGIPPTLELNIYPGLLVTGTVGLNYRVDYAEKLAPTTWLTLSNIVGLPSSPYFVLDPQAATVPSRYYRALLVP